MGDPLPGITLYEDEPAGRFFIDVNNFDLDLNTYTMAPAATTTIDAVLPAWLGGQRLQLSVVTPQANAPTVERLSVSNNTLEIKLGPVEYYAGVVVEKEAEWAAWQAAHFTAGEIDAGLAHVGADPDGDGMDNEQEYIAGSDPRDGTSVFDLRISGNAESGGMELAFNSATGRLYSLFFTTDLVAKGWGVLETNIVGSGTVVFIGDTNEWSQIYYRMEASRP